MLGRPLSVGAKSISHKEVECLELENSLQATHETGIRSKDGIHGHFANIINKEEVSSLVLPIWLPSHLGEMGL